MSDDKKINERTRSPEGRPKGPRGVGFLFLLLMLVGLLMLVAFGDQFGAQSHRFETVNSFKKAVADNEVKSITIVTPEVGESEYFTIKGEFRDGIRADGKQRFEGSIDKATKEWLVADPVATAEADSPIEKNNIELRFEKESNFFQHLITGLLPILLIGVLIWFLFLRRGGAGGGPGGVFNFGRSKARMFSKEDVQVKFSDVAGIEEAKEELSEIVQFLKNPTRFTRIGAKIPRGVVMFGPPGCGKTLLAKAIAGEAERPFFSISGSDFVEMFVGVGASRVRDLFKTAREQAPCIVFVDEIDAVGRKRGTGVGGGHDEREQTLNAILVEMDGIGTDEGIIVVAATNRPDVLDPALLRPGRFDRQVMIDLPDATGREAIFQVHLDHVKLADDVRTEELAHATPGFSGADIANLINEAALAAVLDGRSLVEMADLLEARDKVRFGRQKKSRVMDEEDRRVTAYHEAGHTVVQYLTEHTDPVHKVTIIPRGMALGATMSLPEKDRYSLSIDRANETLQILYGGRIAEWHFIKTISSGAENDIERATDLATNMVVKYGFSDVLGPINYAETEQRDFLGGGMTKLKGHSDETAAKIDSEIRRLLDEAYKNAESTLEEYRDKVEDIAQALLKYETLNKDDVVWIMEGKAIEDKRRSDEDKARRQQAARKLAEVEAMNRKPRSDEQPGASGLSDPNPRPA